jgi:hypothetical protein
MQLSTEVTSTYIFSDNVEPPLDNSFVQLNISQKINGKKCRLNINLSDLDMLNQKLCDDIKYAFQQVLKKENQHEGIIMIWQPGDSAHEIIDLELPNGATLHRFVNGGGQEYSAIYEDDKEIFSQVRSREPNMIIAYMVRLIRTGKHN